MYTFSQAFRPRLGPLNLRLNEDQGLLPLRMSNRGVNWTLNFTCYRG